MLRGPRLYVVVAAAALGVLLLWFVLLWGPQSARMEEARERRETAEQENANLRIRLERLRAADARRTELLAGIDRTRVAIPDQPNLAQFILDANDVANQAGIDFISIAPSPPAAPPAGSPPDTPTQISLSISISGGYFQVLDYLNRLLAMPRIVVVDTINVSPQVEGQFVQLSVNLVGRMFTTAQPGDEPAPEEDATTPAPPEDADGANGGVDEEVEG